MPHYFFHFYDGHEWLIDAEGIEMVDAAAIPAMALYQARDVMAGDIRNGKLDLNQIIEVDDNVGGAVHALPFSEALRLKPLAADPRPDRKRGRSISPTGSTL